MFRVVFLISVALTLHSLAESDHDAYGAKQAGGSSDGEGSTETAAIQPTVVEQLIQHYQENDILFIAHNAHSNSTGYALLTQLLARVGHDPALKFYCSRAPLYRRQLL